MIKGVGRLNKWINSKLAQKYKQEFKNIIPKINVETLGLKGVDITLYSMSGEWQFEEQVLSILSFLKNAGKPLKWVIISDGTHTKKEIEYFSKYDFIKFTDWKEIIDSRYLDFVINNECWQYKKFFSYASINITSTTILLDSDVLFLTSFNHYFSQLPTHNWYFTDLWPFLEDGFKYTNEPRYINSGFLLLNKPINWNKGIDYILNRPTSQKVHHFTEQTAIWLVVKDNKMAYLNPALFYTETEDHFTFKNTINHKKIALRHFVGPIRFRLWLAAKEFNYFLLPC